MKKSDTKQHFGKDPKDDEKIPVHMWVELEILLLIIATHNRLIDNTLLCISPK